MGKFVYKPSGLIVEVGEGTSLPDYLFEPVKEEKAAEVAEKPKARRTRKPVRQD